MSNIRLSKNFTLNELLLSQTAIQMNRPVEANEEEIENLKRLCVEVLQPIRDEFGPVYVISGLRPLWLNNAVGGSLTSDHLYGRAADFNLQGMKAREACIAISRLLPSLPYKQMIQEFNSWVHISIPAYGTEPKREQLTASKKNGKTVYSQGIE